MFHLRTTQVDIRDASIVPGVAGGGVVNNQLIIPLIGSGFFQTMLKVNFTEMKTLVGNMVCVCVLYIFFLLKKEKKKKHNFVSLFSSCKWFEALLHLTTYYLMCRWRTGQNEFSWRQIVAGRVGGNVRFRLRLAQVVN